MSVEPGPVPTWVDPGYVYFDYVNPAVLRLLGTGHSVLDVGCGTGMLGQAAAGLGNRVTGVELSEVAARLASERLSRVVRRDISDVEGLARELGEQYDRIVFADILEHLVDPLAILYRFRQLLKPDGRILVSLPNAVSWTVRLGVSAGYWEYTDTGIFDRTHLRFFTRASGRRLLERAGFRVERIDVTPNLTRAFWPLLKRMFGKPGQPEDPGAVLRSPLYQTYQRWVEPLETLLAKAFPGLLACQFVYEGKPRQ